METIVCAKPKPFPHALLLVYRIVYVSVITSTEVSWQDTHYGERLTPSSVFTLVPLPQHHLESAWLTSCRPSFCCELLVEAVQMYWSVVHAAPLSNYRLPSAQPRLLRRAI